MENFEHSLFRDYKRHNNIFPNIDFDNENRIRFFCLINNSQEIPKLIKGIFALECSDELRNFLIKLVEYGIPLTRNSEHWNLYRHSVFDLYHLLYSLNYDVQEFATSLRLTCLSILQENFPVVARQSSLNINRYNDLVVTLNTADINRLSDKEANSLYFGLMTLKRDWVSENKVGYRTFSIQTFDNLNILGVKLLIIRMLPEDYQIIVEKTHRHLQSQLIKDSLENNRKGDYENVKTKIIQFKI